MPADEESPLLQDPIVQERQIEQTEYANQLIVYGSFIGIFVAAADDSLVLSTWSTISSQFQRLSEGSWLVVAYNFGFCVSLPIHGTLSSMYGRKDVLLGSYALFAVGCLACGPSGSLKQLVLARVLAGISGGGMISLVSIIITGVLFSTQFIGMSFGAPKGCLETYITTYYLFQQLGLIISPASGVAVVQRIFGSRLSQNLEGLLEKQFIGRILDDVRFAEMLSDSVQRVVRSSYLYAFQFVPLISAACSMVMLPIIMWQREETVE